MLLVINYDIFSQYLIAVKTIQPQEKLIPYSLDGDPGPSSG